MCTTYKFSDRTLVSTFIYWNHYEKNSHFWSYWTKHLVAQALAKGHFVRALVRNTNKLKECLAVEQVQEDHPNLEIWLVLKVF